MRTLVITAESYPWDLAREQTFLEPELPFLVPAFDRVVLVPQQLGGARLPIAPTVEVDESFAREAATLGPRELLARAGRTTLVGEELLRRRTTLANPAALRRLLIYAGRAHHARDWARRFLARNQASTSVTFYSYWWTAPITGFAMARKYGRLVRAVSRCHGFDLYEERHTPAYLPCRSRSARLLDALLPDSETGRQHLVKTMGSALPAQTRTMRLGVFDPKVRCRPSDDGVLRVVTCSMQVAVKRLHLLVDGLSAAGRARETRRVEWTHFGEGALQGELEARIRAKFPGNVSMRFAGYSTQQALFEWYGAHPVDVFVNVSASEGTSVSIMEALACGIPVLATAVGGNPEVCTERNGVLLSANPEPQEIAEKLERVAGHPALRDGSRELWARQYDARANFEAFVALLRS